MDKTRFEKLRRKGALVQLESGDEAVRVCLQYRPRLTLGSRSDRRQRLRRLFEAIASEVESAGGSVNLETLSVSGQAVEATLPINHFDTIEEQLKQRRFRTDILLDLKIV